MDVLRTGQAFACPDKNSVRALTKSDRTTASLQTYRFQFSRNPLSRQFLNRESFPLTGTRGDFFID